MSSRTTILEAIRQSNNLVGAQVPMPDLKVADAHTESRQSREDAFIRSALKQGADVAKSADIPDPDKWISKLYPEAESILSAVTKAGFPPRIVSHSGRPDLRQVDLSIIRGAFGVAENGCVWIPESSLPMRILPFICTHLIILLGHADLVSNMHEAYNRIRLSETPFGVFIAGPSKTADIEQSLVIGAQGPKSVMILLEELIP